MNTQQDPERVQTVVIGGGQAGLSVGYHLARRGLSFVILDGNGRIGDSWRNRWESLRLFSPARFNGLDGMAFPAPPHSFPTKDEMADYLEAYAARFALPVRTGVRVTRVAREGRHYVVTAGDLRFVADHVVVAMASYQAPRIPPFAAQLDPDITQMHSVDYRAPRQLRKGGVLIVGAGNSGAEIAAELARHHRVWMSGKPMGELPFNQNGWAARAFLLKLMFRVVFHRVLTVDTLIGRKARPQIIAGGTPLIRVKSKALAAAGIERVSRTVGVRDGRPLLDDGRVLDVANVIWCTGFHGGLSWIDLPVFESDGEPRHERGIAVGEPGLYFVGLHFLYSMSSSMIHGVGRDAERIASTIDARVRTAPAADVVFAAGASDRAAFGPRPHHALD